MLMTIMEILTSTDLYLLQICAVGALLWKLKSRIAAGWLRRKVVQPELPLLDAAKHVTKSALPPTRSILTQLQQTGKQCMIFYGSQTGTAEKFAHSLAREAQGRFRLGCFVADMDDYDFNDIVKLSQKHLTIFIVATYGEGEPTDNAIGFRKFLDNRIGGTDLGDFYYTGFGLGSSSYTHYNAMITRVDGVFASNGAHLVGSIGLGDDGKSTLEEDFAHWTEANLPKIAAHFGLKEIPFVYKPAFTVIENLKPSFSDQRHVFRGEPNKGHLYSRIQGPFTPQNPYPATLTDARNISQAWDRKCLHMEFDISGTSISYDTGDHVAVWPVNSDCEVDLFLGMFGLESRRDLVIDIAPNEISTKMPVPSKTTYGTLVRYHLEIGAPLTRHILRRLSLYATTDDLGLKLLQLAENKIRFDKEVLCRQLTIAQLLSMLSDTSMTRAALDVPFSLIIELLPKLRPRHYSISSSSLTSRKAISITAVVDRKEDSLNQVLFRGVSTGYLSALVDCRDSDNSSSKSHTLLTKRQAVHGLTVPRPLIHVRRSKFRPPFDPSTPIIMIGPGTGVAPFRAFVQERACQYKQGRTIGRTILFFGCRDSAKDFIYKEEWEDIIENQRLGDGAFRMYTAFSRQPGQTKRYVQDLIVESQQHTEIRELVFTKNAHVYICGNAARMAKDVARAMEFVLAGGSDGGTTIAQLKKEGRWCEDVW